jgi:hypothetical protein
MYNYHEYNEIGCTEHDCLDCKYFDQAKLTSPCINCWHETNNYCYFEKKEGAADE